MHLGSSLANLLVVIAKDLLIEVSCALLLLRLLRCGQIRLGNRHY